MSESGRYCMFCLEGDEESPLYRAEYVAGAWVHASCKPHALSGAQERRLLEEMESRPSLRAVRVCDVCLKPSTTNWCARCEAHDSFLRLADRVDDMLVAPRYGEAG